mgnify:CR=1 FL=1
MFTTALIALILAVRPIFSAGLEADIRLIGVTELSAGDAVGGLSGLDYDAATDRWIAVTDDRGAHGGAATFVLEIDYDERRVSGARVVKRDALVLPEGVTPDVETVRIDPRGGALWWATEGESEPAVFAGGEVWPLARFFGARENGARGVRSNLAVEGLDFALEGDSVWIVPEGPLEQDGPEATASVGARVRLTEISRGGAIVRQVAYEMDPISATVAKGGRSTTGVSEILCIGRDRLLVLERSGGEVGGRWRFAIKLYEADVSGATRLEPGVPMPAAIVAATKRLVFDFGVAGRWVDNVEGLSRGRRLKDGRETLVAVSDDNFNPTQRTQVWVFEVAPSLARPRQWDDAFFGVVHDDERIAGFTGRYRWMSNYFPCPVTYEGRTYGSSEAAYHASKFPETERDEFTTLGADESKKLSRRKKVDTAWWDERKERVMREILWAKFTQNPELRAALLETGGRELEEANWWGDRFWGTVNGEGRNVLGRLLMETRAALRASSDAPPSQPEH